MKSTHKSIWKVQILKVWLKAKIEISQILILKILGWDFFLMFWRLYVHQVCIYFNQKYSKNSNIVKLY